MIQQKQRIIETDDAMGENMEQDIRKKINKLIEKCIQFEKECLCENGDIKEEYQETIIDRYLEFLITFENEISISDLGICVEGEKDYIKRYYIVYYILDERIFRQLNKEIGINTGWKAEARIRLYMMYLKAFREVLFLLSNGYSDCALARTRTLYELGVYISIVNNNSDDLAERFCKYCNVQSMKMAEVLSSEEKADRIERFIDQFNYEEGYKKENGWARILFPNIKEKSNVQFRSLVDLTLYKDYLNMYKMACNFVHGSLFSCFESLDSAEEQRGKNFWNTSPNGEGINEVIQFLKIYSIVFISDYINSSQDNMLFENMLMVYLVGKEVLENEI